MRRLHQPCAFAAPHVAVLIAVTTCALALRSGSSGANRSGASALVAANVTVSRGGLWCGRSGDGELGAMATADVLLTDAVFDPPPPIDPPSSHPDTVM